MKYQLLEDHQVRLSDTIIKAGIYTEQELKEFYKHDSFQWCLKYTSLNSKLIPYNEEIINSSQEDNKSELKSKTKSKSEK